MLCQFWAPWHDTESQCSTNCISCDKAVYCCTHSTVCDLFDDIRSSMHCDFLRVIQSHRTTFCIDEIYVTLYIVVAYCCIYYTRYCLHDITTWTCMHTHHCHTSRMTSSLPSCSWWRPCGTPGIAPPPSFRFWWGRCREGTKMADLNGIIE